MVRGTTTLPGVGLVRATRYNGNNVLRQILPFHGLGLVWCLLLAPRDQLFYCVFIWPISYVLREREYSRSQSPYKRSGPIRLALSLGTHLTLITSMRDLSSNKLTLGARPHPGTIGGGSIIQSIQHMPSKIRRYTETCFHAFSTQTKKYSFS